jgi:hypothetical protein
VAWAEARKKKGLTGRDTTSMGLVLQGLRAMDYGIPNACTRPCHENKSLAWANQAVVKWYGPVRRRGNDCVAALEAARNGPIRRFSCMSE